jgi:acyl transferase domain-containing protein
VTAAAAAEQVAIVGMAVLAPGADSLESYWNNLVSGRDAISDLPPGRWDTTDFYDPQANGPDRVYCRRGGFLDAIDFDPLQFGVVPTSVTDTEVEQLILLRMAAAAVADAGGRDRMPDPARVGVIVGRLGCGSTAQGKFMGRVRTGEMVRDILRQLLPDVDEHKLDLVARKVGESFGPFRPENVIGLTPNLAASRVANRLGLGGPAYNVDAACASSLIAVSNAVAELQNGKLDAVLAGGVHHLHDVTFWSMFCQLRALSRRGEIRPLDKAADGLLIGEATGMVLLKRLPDAVRDGDRIYAVIRGTGTSSDGRTASLFSPDTRGQVLALRRAWASAGLDPAAPSALGLLEAHGTATPTGDAAELATTAEVFGAHRHGTQPVIGSVKSMIGHTMAAAGIVSLIKAALAVSKGVLLPTLHCDDPHPRLHETRFVPIAAAQPWTGPGPRRAAVSAFGFGGINAHVILEQSPEPPPSGRRPADQPGPCLVHEPDQVILLAGSSPAAVSGLLDTDDSAIRERGSHQAHDATSAPGPECRLGIVGPTARSIAVAREVAAKGDAWRGGLDIWFSPRPLLADGAGQIAFVFPGLEADVDPQVADVAARFGLSPDEPARLGCQGLGVDIVRAGLLLHDALQRLGVTADALAGYSLGEWSAWAAAGIVERETIYRLAAQPLDSPRVSTVVIGAGCARVEPSLARYPGVALAIDSAPQQSVLSGPTDQVDRLIADLRHDGVLCQLLPFQAGAHTEHYLSAAQTLRAAGDLAPRPGGVPVWSATLAALTPADPAELSDLFFQALVEPVRFRGTVTAMHDAGIRAFLQVGPGHLASVVHENLRGREHLAIPVNVSHRSGISQLKRVATALWAEGAAPDLRALAIASPSTSASPDRRRIRPVRLELGWSGIQLGPEAATLLGSPRAGSRASAGDEAPLARLRSLSGRSAVAREFTALLEETTRSAADVLSAMGVAEGMPPAVSAAARRPGPATGRPAGPSAAVQHVPLRVSLEAMPYLNDHCLFAQPPHWPDASDRWPVVPAATITELIIGAVERLAGEPKVVEVTAAQFNRWVLAEPARDIDLTVRAAGPGRFAVSLGSYARATVHTAAAYPEPPAIWQRDAASEQSPRLSAEQLYEESAFHGPVFRGITRVTGLGQRHVCGEVRTPAVPGGWLDNGWQLLGDWMHLTQSYRRAMLPVRFGSLRIYRPTPPSGTLLQCIGLIDAIDEYQVSYRVQYICGDKVLAQLEAGIGRRFEAEAMVLHPADHFFAAPQPEGWVVAAGCWADAMTPIFIANRALGTRGYEEYERQPLPCRMEWLLTRLAIKDAVRHQLWREGARNVFPIEVGVTEDRDGRPRVHGWAGRVLPSYDVSVAHAGKLAVAIARATPDHNRADGTGVGIAIAEPPTAPPAAAGSGSAVSGPEQAVLDAAAADSGEHQSLWLARFLAGKKAVAKASGAGRDCPCTITAATPGLLRGQVADRAYQVGYREIENPAGSSPPQYVVAWTWGLGMTPDGPA